MSQGLDRRPCRMSNKRTTFHRFNKNIDKEPQEVSTNVQADSRKIEKAVFTPAIRVEESTPEIDIHPNIDSLKELFGELGALLKEEPVNTNPYPIGPLPSERNAPAADPTPSLPVPADAVVKQDPDEDQELENRTQPAKVEEARIEHFHALADSIGPKEKPVAVVAAPEEIKPRKWVFKVIRNAQGLIDTIEASS